MANESWSDQKIEILVGMLLRTGVFLSAFVVSIGGIIYLMRHGGQPVNFATFHGEPTEYRTIRGIIHGVWTIRGRGIIQFGLLLLIATPVARVALSIIGFTKERDHLYVALTSVVFVILLYTLLVSI